MSYNVAKMGSIAGCLALLAIGCGGGSDAKRDNKVKVSYIGLTCEAPIFAAHELGFFKDEGLDVELVKTDWDTMRDGLDQGRLDATFHLTMFLLKPIEKGANIKITGGIHTGCLRLQAGRNSGIKKLEDFKGKRIAIANMGNPPFMFATRVFNHNGIDTNDIKWVVYRNEEMELALDQGKIDGVATAEPIGTILLAHNKVQTMADQAVDAPYKDEYCCVTVVSGQLARSDPVKAAKVTRVLLKGAKWVNSNQAAAAKMAVEKKYIGATAAINAQAIAKLNYAPGVARARRDLLSAAQDMKKCAFLKPSTDPEELVKRAWLNLEGVSDQWIEGLSVDKVAGGGKPTPLSPAAFAALFNNTWDCREFRFCDCDW